jgi:RNA polymerase sigma factor (sigma-70 family)
MIDEHYIYINELVKKIKEDESSALFELFSFYKPLIFSAISRCLAKDKNLISYKEDLVHESIFVLQKLSKNYDPALSYFSYYLSTRIDHALLSHFKNVFDVKAEPTEHIVIHTYFDPFNRVNNEIVIDEAMQELNEKQREAIDLYFFQELTQEEAAERLGIQQAAFSKRLDRALDKLRAILSDSFKNDGIF